MARHSTGPATVHIRRAQCWVDADILLAGLDIQPGDRCASVGSAGDSVLALLTADPGNVLAVDPDPAQLACLELRIAAFRCLTHAELLELLGARTSTRRENLYQRCRRALGSDARRVWDSQPRAVQQGVASAGHFEQGLARFRRWVLPLIHGRRVRDRLLLQRDRRERETFYRQRWNNRRWRALWPALYSPRLLGPASADRRVMADWSGHDMATFFRGRARHALVELDPSENPYLTWILEGRYGEALPLPLRARHFETIRERVDRIEIHRLPLYDFLGHTPGAGIQRWNLSDFFEPLDDASYRRVLTRIVRGTTPGGRLMYWNRLISRQRPPSLRGVLRSYDTLASSLHNRDRVFFYQAIRIEERY